MSKCREYALNYITFKDRTEKEVTEKLSQKGFGEEEISEAIEFLKEYKYLDDESYASRFINDAVKLKKWGKTRIRMELLRRGISSDIVEKSIDEILLDSSEVLLEEMKRRFDGADLSNIKERNRIFGYFARRGYSPNEIKGAMNTLCSFNDIVDYDE